MANNMLFHVLVTKEPDEDAYSALCLELDIAADGSTPEEAVQSLQEAVSLHVGCALEEHDYSALFRPAPQEEWDRFFSQISEPKILLEPISA